MNKPLRVFIIRIVIVICCVTVLLWGQTTIGAVLSVAQTWTALQTFGDNAIVNTQAVKDNSTKAASTAYVDRPTSTSSGTSVTLTGPRQYFDCTGTCTITVPVPAAGYEFCVGNNVAVSTVITFSAIGSLARYGKTDQSAYGTAGTGTLVSSGATGDKVCIRGQDSTHYIVGSFNGSWTAN